MPTEKKQSDANTSNECLGKVTAKIIDEIEVDNQVELDEYDRGYIRWLITVLAEHAEISEKDMTLPHSKLEFCVNIARPKVDACLKEQESCSSVCIG